MVDDTDRQIIAILQENARTAIAEIARRVGVVPSCVHERIRKLEARGIIEGYEVRLNPAPFKLGLVAFILVRSDESGFGQQTSEQLADLPEVQEVYHIAGEDCFLVKVRTADTESLGRLLREKFGEIGTIRSTRTTIVLETVKETSRLPIYVGVEGDADA